uniref:Peptidase S54 rhomboid domain-containing protein n=1 Tax=Parascaris equorum TaxID=6256 RepID=A0A914RPY1_PAREQ
MMNFEYRSSSGYQQTTPSMLVISRSAHISINSLKMSIKCEWQTLLHLVPNVAFQLLVGVPLELVHKMWRIAPIYLLAVILGDFCKFLVPFLHCTFGCFDSTIIALKKR